MSARDQAAELRQIQEELPNVNLDGEVVFAAKRVKISRRRALVFWDDGATISFIQGRTKGLTYNVHSEDYGWKPDRVERKYL